MRGALRWAPAAVALLWLGLQTGFEAAGVYSYWLRAPFLQAGICLVPALAVLVGPWRGRRRTAWVLAALGLGWALWSWVQMVAVGGWTQGRITFFPALLLLALAEIVRHWPRRR